MAIQWESKFGWPQIIQITMLIVGFVGGGFSLYLKLESASSEVASLREALREKGNELTSKLSTIDSSAKSIEKDVNLIRNDVTALKKDGEFVQKQINEIKEDVNQLEDGQ